MDLAADDDDLDMQHMLPERDYNSSGGAVAGDDGHHARTVEEDMEDLGAQAEAAFNHQRYMVGRMPREELEDRYIRLLEENVIIKKHACKQVSHLGSLAH